MQIANSLVYVRHKSNFNGGNFSVHDNPDFSRKSEWKGCLDENRVKVSVPQSHMTLLAMKRKRKDTSHMVFPSQAHDKKNCACAIENIKRFTYITM